MKNRSYDFSGWATKNNIKCSDGRTIRRDAFKECDGATVPLVYNHDHENINSVIGHVDLENREDGVYAYGYLNNTQAGKDAKIMLENGDITSMSIYANKLQHVGKDVVHGMIREVSLVLAGANPGARIEYVMSHGEDMFDEDPTECDIYSGEQIELAHAEEEDEKDESKESETEDVKEDESDETNPEENNEDEDGEEEIEHSDSKSEDFDYGAVYNNMSEEEQYAVKIMVGLAVQQAMNEKNKSEDADMKHNVFENEDMESVLSHDEIKAIFNDIPRYGSLKEACLQHSITDIDILFPDAKNATAEPTTISRNMTWVQRVLGGTHHTPFSRVKSIHFDITADEARAKGYVKGNQKVEEVIAAITRKTGPQTVYKKQGLDRDDIIDITDFNVVSYIKSEMRMMLEEELARAILIGDGRSILSPDKIKEDCIRPIWTDNSVYTINKTLVKGSTYAKDFIEMCIRARKDYKGSGNPVLYTTETLLTDMLLLEDGIGRPLYDTIEKLKTRLRVSDIVTVEVMEGATRTVSDVVRELGGLIVNLADYSVGADKGGAVSMFEDFDIDYNKEKYLIETRCSGALIKPYSAIAIEFLPSGSAAAPAEEPDNGEVTEG